MPTPFERTWPVTALGRFSTLVSEIPDVRKRLQAELIAADRPANLRHADEQGVACLAAMREALTSCNRPASEFQNWGVVAAPRTPGRSAMTDTILRFPKDGAWGASPHVIPNCSLHSPSGLVSVTYGLRGPNYGVGGVAGRECDIWTALVAFDSSLQTPGAWLLLSAIGQDDMCRAIAMAVQFQDCAAAFQVTVHFGAMPGLAMTPKFTLESLDRVLALPHSPLSHCRWSLGGGGTMEWRWRANASLRAAA